MKWIFDSETGEFNLETAEGGRHITKYAPILRALPVASEEQIEVATKILQQPLDNDHKAGMEVIKDVLSGAQVFETAEGGKHINWMVFRAVLYGRGGVI